MEKSVVSSAMWSRFRRHCAIALTTTTGQPACAIRASLVDPKSRALPGPAAEAIHTLEVLDAARVSAAEHRAVTLSGSPPSE
jgi:hypothetical protein